MAKVLGTLAIFSLLILRPVAAAPTCSTINSKLSSCISYIEGRIMGGPSGACCAGVKTIAAQIKGKPDLVVLCNCVKSVIAKLGDQVDSSRVSSLPKKCGVAINLPPIDKDYDCSKIAENI